MRLVMPAFMAFIPLAALASIASAQSPSTRSFAVTLNADTLAIERLTRTAGRVDADFLDKAQGVRLALAMTLAPGALVSRVEITARMAASATSAPPLQHVVLAFTADTVSISMASGDMPPAQKIGTPHNSIPFLNLSVATAEQIIMRARAIGGSPVQVPVFIIAGGKMPTAVVAFAGADSAVLSVGGADLHARITPAGEIIGGAVPAQNVRFTMTASGAGAVPVSPTPPVKTEKPDYAAPAGAPYTAEEVRVKNARAGIELAGTLTVPRHAAGARVPAVVMITGSGPEDRDEATAAIPGWRPFRQIADTLGRRGIAVLRLDDRGVGGTPLGPQGPTSADFSDDIRAALTFLRARGDIDVGHLALIGHSEGGMIAPMIAASDPALHAIVLIAGPSRTGRAVSDQQVRAAFVGRGLSGAALDSAIATNARAREAQLADNPWIKFWFSYDPIPTAKRVAQPVLIVQGATDTQVSPDQAEELAAAFRAGGNRDVTVRLLPEINHLLVHDANGAFSNYDKLTSLSVSRVVLGAIADWLAAKLR
ncbi:MAG: alpha/beta fold hydrolase [Gemmatimonadaceae bacterium]